MPYLRHRNFAILLAVAFLVVTPLAAQQTASPQTVNFRLFGPLPQEAHDAICFRTFVPAEATTASAAAYVQGQIVDFRLFTEQPATVKPQPETSRPPQRVESAAAEPQTVAKPVRPAATLYTANFYCPPCEQWKARLQELPFEVRVVRQNTSPLVNRRGEYLFPVFEYRDGTRLRQFQGSVDSFLEQLTRREVVRRE